MTSSEYCDNFCPPECRWLGWCACPCHDDPNDDASEERTVLAFDAQGVDGYEL